MGDPYWRYADTASVSRPSYTSYLPSDVSTLASQPLWSSRNHLSGSSDYLHKDILSSQPGPYGVDDIMGIGARTESVFSGYTAGTNGNGYRSAWEDLYLLGKRDVMRDNCPGVRNIVDERPDSLRKANGLPAGSQKSNVLFVDALPSDCTRREVSHLFRPFLGFKEIRLVHKEPRNSADKHIVLCFVEFSDSNHALTALEALQGYKFDNKKPDSAALQIHFAHFPFKLPPDREEQGFAHFPYQLQRDKEEQGLANRPTQLPPNREEQGLANRPFQLPPHREEQGLAHFPFQQQSHKDERDRAIPSDGKLRRRTCYECGEKGHLASACWKLQAADVANSVKEVNDMAVEKADVAVSLEREVAVQDEEPQAVKRKFEGSNGSKRKKGKVEASGSKPKKLCAKCKKKHLGECLAKFGGCFRCGKTDHVIRECPVKDSSTGCFNCGEAGHIRSKCPKLKTGDPKPNKKNKASLALVKKVDPPKT